MYPVFSSRLTPGPNWLHLYLRHWLVFDYLNFDLMIDFNSNVTNKKKGFTCLEISGSSDPLDEIGV